MVIGPPSLSRTTLTCIIFIPGVWPDLRPEVREVGQRDDDDADRSPRPPRIGTTTASRPNTTTIAKTAAMTMSVSTM